MTAKDYKCKECGNHNQEKIEFVIRGYPHKTKKYIVCSKCKHEKLFAVIEEKKEIKKLDEETF